MPDTPRVPPAAAIEAMARAAGDDPRKLAAVARFARTAGQSADAFRHARRARALAPDDPEIAILTQDALAGGVPKWHFTIVRDTRRNDLYEAAIRRAVHPGARVLDIGSGTGLLAMMAARAGAADVISCEMNPAVAAAAAEIAARNGLGDRVRVIAKKSTDLDPVTDLGGKVDVVVSEIVSNDLLGEHALPVMEDAVARLLKPGGKMIPAQGSVHVALAEMQNLDGVRIDSVSGFDVSPFNRLMRTPLLVRSKDTVIRRSAPARLFAFDFARGGQWPRARAACELSATGGRVNGHLQWIALTLDSETFYEVALDPERPSAWAPLFFPLDSALTPDAETAVPVEGLHDMQSVRSWIARKKP